MLLAVDLESCAAVKRVGVTHRSQPETAVDLFKRKTNGQRIMTKDCITCRAVILPAKAREYVLPVFLVCVSVCLSGELSVGAELQATNRDPRWWIGGQPPDMVASCDISRCFHLTNKQSRTSSGRVIRAWRW